MKNPNEVVEFIRNLVKSLNENGISCADIEVDFHSNGNIKKLQIKNAQSESSLESEKSSQGTYLVWTFPLYPTGTLPYPPNSTSPYPPEVWYFDGEKYIFGEKYLQGLYSEKTYLNKDNVTSDTEYLYYPTSPVTFKTPYMN